VRSSLLCARVPTRVKIHPDAMLYCALFSRAHTHTGTPPKCADDAQESRPARRAPDHGERQCHHNEPFRSPGKNPHGLIHLDRSGPTRSAAFAEPVVLHFVKQRLVADLQLCGRLFAIPPGLLEHAFDHTFLGNLSGTSRDRLEINRFPL